MGEEREECDVLWFTLLCYNVLYCVVPYYHLLCLVYFGVRCSAAVLDEQGRFQECY
jgi:hypothetical protein